MDSFLNGILLGLTLTIMVGPIMIAIVQTSLEKGWKAGLSVGFGIWISDLLFIMACFIGVKQLSAIITHPNFEIVLGLAGTMILIGFGIGMIVVKAKDFDLESNSNSSKDYAAFWTKGFLVNTVNPFTFFFWISISLGIINFNSPSFFNYIPFYVGIMLPIVLGDVIKTFGAHWIRGHINSSHVQKLRLVSGIAFIIFGVVLATRVLW